jgi:hypothetical protein
VGSGIFLLLAFLVILSSLLDAAQRRYMPTGYMEPIDIWVGLDPVLTFPKLVFRLGLPMLLGAVTALLIQWQGIAVETESVAAVVAGLTAYVLVYPPLTRRTLRPYSVYNRQRAATMGYLTFVLLNATLGFLGAAVFRFLQGLLTSSSSGSGVMPLDVNDARTLVLGIVSSLLAAVIWRVIAESMNRR